MDEIISSWDTADELFLELATDDVGRHRARARLQEMFFADREMVMRFRVEDANGQRVTFPLRLISDTTFPVDTEADY